MSRFVVIAIFFLPPGTLNGVANRGFADDRAAAGASKEIATIEALGGRVQRDESRSGRPVTTIFLAGSENLKDEDLQLLSAFPRLQTLELSGTAISDSGLKHLARLKSLTYLGLIRTKITDAGLKELVGLQNLEGIRIGNTAITDAGLKDLAKLKNLKVVGLIGTQVTDAGLKEFGEALPDMQHNGGKAAPGAGGQGGGQRPDPNFDVSVSLPAYPDKHPSILFDEAHQNFHTASGRYKVFADLVTNDGYRVVPNKEVFTPERLVDGDILVIANAMVDRGTAKSAFTESECDSVQNWVKAGGSLLLITDHEPFGSASEDLGKRFGVEMSLLVAGDPANETNEGLLFSREKNQLGDHPIMMGRNKSEQVDRVLTFTGQSLKGPAESVALLKFANTARHEGSGGSTSAAGRNQGLALKYGKGRVVVMGEAAELSAQIYGVDPIEKMGMNVPGCDNRKMALNLVHWLSGLTD